MGMRADYVGTQIELRQEAARTTRASRRQIAIEAKKLERLSRAYAPYLTGALERSHATYRFVSDSRRVAYAVGFGDNLDYAVAVHEGGIGGSVPGTGEKSQAKAERLGLPWGVISGPGIGPFFLERAYEELKDEMEANMKRAVAAS